MQKTAGLTLTIASITMKFVRKKATERANMKSPKKPRKMAMQMIALSRKVDLLKALCLQMNTITTPLGHTHSPTPLLVFAVGQGDCQTCDGTDHSNPSNDSHCKHRPQRVGNGLGCGAIKWGAFSCTGKGHTSVGRDRGPHSKVENNTLMYCIVSTTVSSASGVCHLQAKIIEVRITENSLYCAFCAGRKALL